MKRSAVVLLLLFASVVLSGSAFAKAFEFGFGGALRIMSGSVTVPPEWDGIWAMADSTYDCITGLKGTSALADTLCSGQVYTQDVAGSPVTFICTGTADATSFHVTCTGSWDIITDCQITYDMQTDATLSGDNYRSVTTTNVSYAGTGIGCSFLPPSCTRVVTYGTRTGPAPSAYCLTPVKRTTWGQLKISYR
jgi:hypothetical protein